MPRNLDQGYAARMSTPPSPSLGPNESRGAEIWPRLWALCWGVGGWGGQCNTFNGLQVAVHFSAILLMVACSGAYGVHICQLPGSLDHGVTCHNQMCAPLPWAWGGEWGVRARHCSTFSRLHVAVQFCAMLLMVACSGACSVRICQLPGNLDHGVTCHNQLCVPLPWTGGVGGCTVQCVVRAHCQ